MAKKTLNRTEVGQKLRAIGINRSYAWQIAQGHRSPSRSLAKEIEEKAGIPMATWPLPRAVKEAEAA